MIISIGMNGYEKYAENELPEFLAQPAYRLVKNRYAYLTKDMTPKEVNIAVQLLDWVNLDVDAQTYHLRFNDHEGPALSRSMHFEMDIPNWYEETLPSNTSLIFQIRDQLDDYGCVDLSLCGWSQYFAITAAAHLGLALGAHYGEIGERNEKDSFKTIGFRGALEAITYAIQFDDISKKRRSAARKRHTSTNRIKAEFIQFFEQGEFRSNADAARKYLAQLPENLQGVLAPTNAERTLTDCLRQHLKDK